jgi:hypothetical protein
METMFSVYNEEPRPAELRPYGPPRPVTGIPLLYLLKVNCPCAQLIKHYAMKRLWGEEV